jgi:hypothetical protein
MSGPLLRVQRLGDRVEGLDVLRFGSFIGLSGLEHPIPQLVEELDEFALFVDEVRHLEREFVGEPQQALLELPGLAPAALQRALVRFERELAEETVLLLQVVDHPAPVAEAVAAEHVRAEPAQLRHVHHQVHDFPLPVR